MIRCVYKRLNNIQYVSLVNFFAEKITAKLIPDLQLKHEWNEGEGERERESWR